MPQMTLLEMTQDILTAMGSDVVDTINATTEATMVSQVIKNTYYNFMHEYDWPHLHQLGTLTALSDTTQPTKMQIPSNVNRILEIKYDIKLALTDQTQMRTITYLPPQDFLDLVNNRNDQATNVTVYTDSGSNLSINVITDHAPTYWTSFDDNYIWFDSYIASLESTLQAAKSAIYSLQEPTWTADDGFVPDLPVHMFSAFLAQAKVECFNNIKQMPNPLIERDARRQRVLLQHKAKRLETEVPPGSDYYGGKYQAINYGRR